MSPCTEWPPGPGPIGPTRAAAASDSAWISCSMLRISVESSPCFGIGPKISSMEPTVRSRSPIELIERSGIVRDDPR